MVNYDVELRNHLSTLGLPVFYEQDVDSTTKTPCITYLPRSNNDYLMGDNLFYYNMTYYVKLWGHTKAELMPYMEQLSDLMRELGFRRSSYNELATDTQLCLVSLYRGIGYEKL